MLLVRGFVAASFAAGRTVEETIVAEADIQLALTKATELFAMALIFGHFALGADVFLSRSAGGAHAKTLSRLSGGLKVPEVNGRLATGFMPGRGESLSTATRRAFDEIAKERGA